MSVTTLSSLTHDGGPPARALRPTEDDDFRTWSTDPARATRIYDEPYMVMPRSEGNFPPACTGLALGHGS